MKSLTTYMDESIVLFGVRHKGVKVRTLTVLSAAKHRMTPELIAF